MAHLPRIDRLLCRWKGIAGMRQLRAELERDGNQWRFCEVKREGDRLNDEQLMTLAVLHLLTGAPVAVVHLLPKGRFKEPGYRSVTIQFHQGRRMRWSRWRELKKKSLGA
jgi:hypothetical protein